MSQAGTIDTDGGVVPPEVPTEFDANIGSAVPVANILNILGTTQAAGTSPVHTTGSGNTITTIVQLGQSNAVSSSSRAGLASFDSADFTVDINGFVALAGGATTTAFNIDVATLPGVDPVVPSGANEITVTGGQTTSGMVANVIRTHTYAANSYVIEIQQSGTNAAEATGLNGVCHFNSTEFTVSNGFVSLIGGSLAIDSIAVQTGTSPVVPTAAGLLTINGAVVAAGTNPIRTNGTGANTLAVEVQTSQALAAADATKIGLSNFDSASFSVAATGFVTLSTTGAGKTITGDSGGALSPTANNWNILGLSGSKTSGSGSTLTIKSPPFSQVGGAGTSALNTGEFVTAAVTRTLPVSAGLADGDLFIYVCTTAGALVIQSVGAQKIRIGNQLSSAAGTATSNAIGDSVTLRFDATQGFFMAVSVIGTWTLA